MTETAPIPVLVLTGPVGVGKSTVAAEVSERLDAAAVAHALVEIDALRWCFPRPPGDPFRLDLALRNLAAIWPNFRAAGARRLVLVDVVISRAQLARYAGAVPGAAFVVIRLRASPATLESRVRQRELGAGLERHLRRATELVGAMERARLEDILVETDGRTPGEIAQEILVRCGWLVVAEPSSDGDPARSGP